MKELQNLEWPALSYQPHLLDILFDRMPIGIAILDRELRVQRFNPTWAEYVVRYSPGSAGRIVPGVGLLELTPGNEAAVRAVFEPVLAGEQVHQEDFRLEIGGITSYWDAIITPIIENGKVVGILHLIADMTERKQAEEALLWRSRADLGRSWMGALAIKAEYALVTQGFYRHIRHPLYAAHWL